MISKVSVRNMTEKKKKTNSRNGKVSLIFTHLGISIQFIIEGRKRCYVPNKRRRRKRTPRA